MERPKGQHLRNKDYPSFAKHHFGRNVRVLIRIADDGNQDIKQHDSDSKSVQYKDHGDQRMLLESITVEVSKL